ncbi:MAG: DUF445 family protein [Victivallaceae bacterium]
MKIFDHIIKIISWATIVGLILQVIVLRGFNFTLIPNALKSWLIPILTAAAVGYLTNWLAIYLLFKPYKKHCGFIQGVIPRHKAKIGRELGQLIPEHLLKPDELTDHLKILLQNYLQNPTLTTQIRHQATTFIGRYRNGIADFLLPYVEQALQQAMRANFTAEKLNYLYEQVAIKSLTQPEKRQFIAEKIAGELQGRTPELTNILKTSLRRGANDYIKNEYPTLSTWFSADKFADKLIQHLNWPQIQAQISQNLGEENTQNIIADELTAMSMRFKNWLNTPAGTIQLESFISNNKPLAENFIRNYLAENLSNWVDAALKKEIFWQTIDNQILPLVQSFILHQLKKEKQNIIRNLDLSGKIESAISQMDIKQFHAMILRASDDNLTLIQLLGYFLGALAGGLLIFVQ